MTLPSPEAVTVTGLTRGFICISVVDLPLPPFFCISFRIGSTNLVVHDMTPGQGERSRVASPRSLTGEEVHDPVVLRAVGRSPQNLVTERARGREAAIAPSYLQGDPSPRVPGSVAIRWKS